MTEENKTKEEEVIAKLDTFDELPDAPPKRRIKLSWVGKLSVGVLVFWIIICVIGPSIAPYHEMDMEGDDSFLDAYDNFYLGTDHLGRDTLSRVIFGARNTIGISLAATLLAYLIVIAALGSSITILISTAAVIYATSVFRIARALGQDIMVQDFVEAARARGENVWWIIKSEVLPSAAMPLATDFGLRLVFVVLFISSLSFLGLGVQPPASDWGSMVRENLQGLTYGSYAAIWPAVAIASFTIAINLIVDYISAKSGGSLAKKMV